MHCGSFCKLIHQRVIINVVVVAITCGYKVGILGPQQRLAVSAGEAAARFVNNWAMLAAVKPYLQPLMLSDIHKVLDDEDQAYFREQREKRFGKKLEEARPRHTLQGLGNMHVPSERHAMAWCASLPVLPATMHARCDIGKKLEKSRLSFIACIRHAMAMCARLPRPPMRMITLVRVVVVYRCTHCSPPAECRCA